MFCRTPGVFLTIEILIAKRALLAWERLASGVSFDLTSCKVMAD